MASGTPQTANRGGAGRRRQGPSSGQTGIAKTEGPAPDAAPALRSLEELRAEWLQRKAKTSTGTGACGIAGERSSGGEKRRQKAPKALLPEDTKHNREFMLKQRPRPGARPKGFKLSTVLVPSEDGAWPSRRSRAEIVISQEDDTSATQHESKLQPNSPPTATEERVAEFEEKAAPEGKHAEETRCALEVAAESDRRSEGSLAASVGVESVDAPAWGLEQDEADRFFFQVEEEDAGVEESRGFSKWFVGAARRKASSSSSGHMFAEAGMSTDAGSGVDESRDESDEEATPEAPTPIH